MSANSNGRTRLLSPETRTRIDILAASFPRRQTALLPGLKIAQEEAGYLPPDVVAEVADIVGVPHPSAQELVAFYTMLREHPEGNLHVVVCDQLPCALGGSRRLLRDLRAGLGIQEGEITPDGAVSLERTAECFGACHRAPVARVNDDYWENLDPERTARLIAHLAAAPTSTGGRR